MATTVGKAGDAASGPGSILDWLLEEDDPSVRLFSLTRLCGEAEDSPQATKARRALMKTGPAAPGARADLSEGVKT